MARQLGMKQPQWARYESGVSAPSIELLAHICRVHACSADWLLGLNEKSSVRQNFSVRAASGGIAIGGVGNRVSGTIVASGDAGHAPMCAKCPYRKKLTALEKVLNKS